MLELRFHQGTRCFRIIQIAGRSVLWRISSRLVSIMIQRNPVDPQNGQVRTSRFVRTAWRALQLKSRAAGGRQRRTRRLQRRSATRSCYHQNLPGDKRVTSFGRPCGSRRWSPVAYSLTSGAASLSTTRATRRPQSSRTNARRAEALSSARLANAVPGSSCLCKGPRSANSCSSNWSPRPWQSPEYPLLG